MAAPHFFLVRLVLRDPDSRGLQLRALENARQLPKHSLAYVVVWVRGI